MIHLSPHDTDDPTNSSDLDDDEQHEPEPWMGLDDEEYGDGQPFRGG